MKAWQLVASTLALATILWIGCKPDEPVSVAPEIFIVSLDPTVAVAFILLFLT